MDEIIELMKSFEKRNNISISMLIMSDGSGSVSEFWDYEGLKGFADIEELKDFLKNTNYLLDENGKCFSPVKIKR